MLLFTRMVSEKIAVDRAPSAISGVQRVPERNLRLAQFPAQVHVLAPVVRWEIDEAHIEIFQLAPDLLNPFHHGLQSARGAILLQAKLLHLLTRRDGAAH